MNQSLETLFHRARFLLSAPGLAECPPDSGAEIAFAGRSNAGKSSAINLLTGNHKLARTSKTPGRTQLINFFELDEQSRLVDLPGYGFAKVPLAVKRAWEQNLAEYLEQRQSLRGVVLLMDIRHPLQEFDVNFLHWASAIGMPVHLLLTKSDKLKRGPAQATLLQVQKRVGEELPTLDLSIQTFSATRHEGLRQLVTRLTEWLADPNPPVFEPSLAGS